jgi:hypothetical protein
MREEMENAAMVLEWIRWACSGRSQAMISPYPGTISPHPEEFAKASASKDEWQSARSSKTPGGPEKSSVRRAGAAYFAPARSLPGGLAVPVDVKK